MRQVASSTNIQDAHITERHVETSCRLCSPEHKRQHTAIMDFAVQLTIETKHHIYTCINLHSSYKVFAIKKTKDCT